MTQIQEYAAKCFKDEAGAVLSLIDQLDDNFDKAVDLIINCKGKFIITGVGKSGHIGQKIAATLASTGTPSFFINPLDAYHGDLGMITCDDVVLAISNSGQTDELLRLIPFLNEHKIPVIAMTGNKDSLLALHSNCHITVKVKREACPLNLAPTSSTTAVLAMGDALACALMEVRKFDACDFAVFHPGGSLGRRLLTRAKDIMRTENLPVVNPEMKLCDAILHISEGKLGLVVIVDNEQHVLGIITDGDVRRAMQHKRDVFFSITVSDVMSKNPKTALPETKVNDIWKNIDANKIHSILITDQDLKLVGIVDEFECIKLSI